MSASMKVEVGDIAMTPFEPHGLVKVLSIEPSWWNVQCGTGICEEGGRRDG